MAQAPLLIPDCDQRVFAELPFSRSWREIRQHVGRLHGACVTGFIAEHGAGRLGFFYKHYRFCIRNRGARLEFCVDEAEDLDPVVCKVQGHFASLLSPGTRD